jgi:hypothetical protein
VSHGPEGPLSVTTTNLQHDVSHGPEGPLSVTTTNLQHDVSHGPEGPLSVTTTNLQHDVSLVLKDLDLQLLLQPLMIWLEQY